MSGEWWLVASICCGVFLFGTWTAAAWISRRESGESDNWKLAVLIAGGILVRGALAATTKGYGPDIGTFSAWAAHAADGLTSFYSPGYFADYPPGYIYVLWLVGKLRLLLGLDFDTPAFLLLLKLPAILADSATVWLLYRLAKRHWSNNAAVAVAALYAFNPAVILNSAVWGQVDGVLTLFILLGVLFLERRPALSAASFAMALLIKPQALIFAPLPILWFADRLLRRKQHAAADLLLFSGTAIATFCLGIFPFSINENPGWIFAKYGATLASYPYATLNAFNLFALTGGNFVPVDERLLFLPYALWGYVFIALIVICAALAALKGKDPSRFWYVPLFLSVSVFILSAKMHERYLFPALALALGFSIKSRDRWGLLLFAGFSATQFLNAVEVLAFSYKNIYVVPRLDPLLLAVSLANVLLWFLLVVAGYCRYVKGIPPEALSGDQ
jgi:dolichyl-phosphate-mannose-protein mannosyltransferase